MSSKGYLTFDIVQIDQVHEEFIELLDQLQISQEHQFLNDFETIIEHTKIHFTQEEELLKLHNVSSIREHTSEHNQILSEMQYFCKKAQMGNIIFAKAYVLERLPAWLYQHTHTMDAELAKAMHARS